MSTCDTSVPASSATAGRTEGFLTGTVSLPGMQPESLTGVAARRQGFLTPEMRRLLQSTCGLSGTPVGNVDFTGCWYPEEPSPLFRPCITLAVDEEGRRWIAETRRRRGLPGPVWCVDPNRQVALYVDHRLSQFLARLAEHGRHGQASLWNVRLAARARRIWGLRYAHAMHVAVAHRSLREIRGWLARLPEEAWIYDLRVSASIRGLPLGLAQSPEQWCRCGRLPIFALCRDLAYGALSDRQILTDDATERDPVSH